VGAMANPGGDHALTRFPTGSAVSRVRKTQYVQAW
jgi:hypothetical protein